MTEDNVYKYGDGRRECRTCNRDRAKDRRDGLKRVKPAPLGPMKPKRTYNINLGVETFKQYRKRIHGGQIPVTTVLWEDPVPDLHDPWGEDVPLGQIR